MLQGRGRVDIGVHARRRVEIRMRKPAGDAHHLHHVLDALRPQRIGMRHLVRQRQLVEQAVEMADRRVDIDRLHRVSAGEMDAVEILRQLHQIAVVGPVAGPPPALDVGTVRRRRDVTEHHVPSADGDLAVGIARRQREFGRRLADHLHDQIAAHAHILAVDDAARVAQDSDRIGMQELDADFLQHPHSAIVDSVDAFRRQRFGRPVDIDDIGPRHLPDRRAAAPLIGRAPAALSQPRRCIRRNRLGQRLRDQRIGRRLGLGHFRLGRVFAVHAVLRRVEAPYETALDKRETPFCDRSEGGCDIACRPSVRARSKNPPHSKDRRGGRRLHALSPLVGEKAFSCI